MRAIRRILVAVKDPKSRTLPSVLKAAQIARRCGAQIELFHSITEPVFIDAVRLSDQSLPTYERDVRRTRIECLEAIAERLRAEDIRVSVVAEWDFPSYEAIVRRAMRTRADLIVAQTHQATRKATWLLRFTDWELLRLSPIPVLLVRDAKPYRHPKILAAVDPTHAFAKPSKLDDEILKAGETFAQTLRGTLHAVHAYVPMPAMIDGVDLTARNATSRIEAKASEQARADVEKLLRKTKISKSRVYLVDYHPEDAIPDVAAKIGSAIVVMGAVSRSGLKRAFIGNTAERILDRLPCDVLVVKPPRFVSRVARERRGPRIMVTGSLLTPPV